MWLTALHHVVEDVRKFFIISILPYLHIPVSFQAHLYLIVKPLFFNYVKSFYHRHIGNQGIACPFACHVLEYSRNLSRPAKNALTEHLQFFALRHDVALVLPLPRSDRNNFTMGIPFDYAQDRPENIDVILNGLDRYNPETTAVFQEYVVQQCEDKTYDCYANLALLKLYV